MSGRMHVIFLLGVKQEPPVVGQTDILVAAGQEDGSTSDRGRRVRGIDGRPQSVVEVVPGTARDVAVVLQVENTQIVDHETVGQFGVDVEAEVLEDLHLALDEHVLQVEGLLGEAVEGRVGGLVASLSD